MKNLLVSQELDKKIEWYIHAHGHSSIGGLNLIWTYLHYTGKIEVADRVENLIKLFQEFHKSNDYDKDLKELYEKAKTIENQIKFLKINDDKKKELLKVLLGVKFNIDRLKNIISNPNYQEKLKLSTILLTVGSELINRYPKLLSGDLVGKNSPMNGNNIEIFFDEPSDEKAIQCEGFEMQLLLFNLVSNACEAILGNGGNLGGFGKIWIKIKSEATSIILSIIDDGEILSPENIEKIKTRMFFTTKGRRHGNGMKIIYDIIDKYKANLNITSDPSSHLTTFTIELPVRR